MERPHAPKRLLLMLLVLLRMMTEIEMACDAIINMYVNMREIIYFAREKVRLG